MRRSQVVAVLGQASQVLDPIELIEWLSSTEDSLVLPTCHLSCLENPVRAPDVSRVSKMPFFIFLHFFHLLAVVVCSQLLIIGINEFTNAYMDLGGL